MSQLKDTYSKLTRMINQGVFNAEEQSLIEGRLYSVGVSDIPFSVSAVVDLVFTSKDLLVLLNEYGISSTSDDVLIEFFINSQITGGTPAEVYSNNDLITVLPSTTVVLNPTIDVLGSKNRPDVAIRGVVAGRAGFSATNGSPLYIYAPNQIHHFRFTNRGLAGVIDINGAFGEILNIP